MWLYKKDSPSTTQSGIINSKGCHSQDSMLKVGAELVEMLSQISGSVWPDHEKLREHSRHRGSVLAREEEPCHLWYSSGGHSVRLQGLTPAVPFYLVTTRAHSSQNPGSTLSMTSGNRS